MKIDFTIERTFPVSKDKIYEAWLNSENHSEMTGGEANCSSEEGAEFNAWDGYISGNNVFLVKNEKIVQNWRTSEFESSDEDSKLEITLEQVGTNTKVTLTHTNIPESQTSDYKQGWEEHYFAPMSAYFG